MNIEKKEIYLFLKVLLLTLIGVLYLILPQYMEWNVKTLLFVFFFITLFFFPKAKK